MTFDFMNSAFPWIAIGVLLAIFYVREENRKKNQDTRENYGSLGLLFGVTFGVVMSSILHINVGLTMAAGMFLGLIIGSEIKK